MSKRDIGQEILDGIRDVKAYKAGKKDLRVHTLKEPSPPQVIRKKLKLSQSAFAGLMGVSLRTVQDWEQGAKPPKGSACRLMDEIRTNPDYWRRRLQELATPVGA